MELNEAIIELNKNGLRVLNEYKITSDFDELSAEDKTAFSKLMNRYYDSVKIKDESKKKDRLKEVKKSLKEFLKKVKNSSAKAKIQKAIDNCSNVTGKEEDKKETKKTVTKKTPAKKNELKPEDIFNFDTENYGLFVAKMSFVDKVTRKTRYTYWRIKSDWSNFKDVLTEKEKETFIKKGKVKIDIKKLTQNVDPNRKYSNVLELVSAEQANAAWGEKGFEALKSDILSNVKDIDKLPNFVMFNFPKGSTPGWPSGPQDIEKYGYFFTKKTDRKGLDNNTKPYCFYIVTDEDWDSMEQYNKKQLLTKGFYSIEEGRWPNRETKYIVPITYEEAKEAKSADRIEGYVKYTGLNFKEFIIEFAKAGYMKIIPPEIENILGKKNIVNYKGPNEISGEKFTNDEPYYILKQYNSGYSQRWGSNVPSSTTYKVLSANELKKDYSKAIDKLLNGEKYEWYNPAEAGCGSSNHYYQLIRYNSLNSNDKKEVAKSLLNAWKIGRIEGLPTELHKYARRIEVGNNELVIKNRRLSCTYNERSKEPYKVTKRAYDELSKYIDDYVKSKYGKVYDIVKTCGCKEGYDSEDDEYYWFDAYYPIELDEYILKRMKYYSESTYWVDISYREGSKTIKY